MARHAAVEPVEFSRRPGAVPHLKPVKVVRTIASRAVVHNKKEVVISEHFLVAVKSTYVRGNIGCAAEGVIDRLIALMVARLRRRNDLPMWRVGDVEIAISYLADTGEISLPSDLHES